MRPSSPSQSPLETGFHKLSGSSALGHEGGRIGGSVKHTGKQFFVCALKCTRECGPRRSFDIQLSEKTDTAVLRSALGDSSEGPFGLG